MKILLCVLMIFFVAMLSGCSGSAVKGAAKGAGKFLSRTAKTTVKVADKVDTALDVAEVVMDSRTPGNNSHNSSTPSARTGNSAPATRTGSVRKAGMIAAGGAMAVNEIFSDDNHWIKDVNNGAMVWNPEPQDGESIHWSGDVVREGDNLYAQGRGTLTWYKDGQVIQVDEGTFERGKHNGKFKHTFKSGNVEYSNWNNGEEIPMQNKPDANNESEARQAFINYHKAITNGNYREAYETLSYSQRDRMGSFDSYVSGFATTISSKVSELNLVSSDENSYTFDYTLTARDRDGGRVKVAIFQGQVTMAKDKGRWFVRSAKSSKVSEHYE